MEDRQNGQFRPEVKQVSARKLARRRRTMAASHCVRLAVDLTDSAVGLFDFTPRRAAEFMGVPLHKVNALRRARAGGSLAVGRRERALDRAIGRVIRTAGAAGLDQLSARVEQLRPQAQAAE